MRESRVLELILRLGFTGGLWCAPQIGISAPVRVQLDLAVAPAIPKQLKLFAQMHRESHWARCVASLRSALTKDRDLAPWVYVLGLECAENEKTLTSVQLLNVIALLSQNSNWLQGASWSDRMQSRWKSAFFRLLEMSPSGWGKRESELFWDVLDLVQSVDRIRLTNDELASVWRFAAELSLKAKGKEASFALLERVQAKPAEQKRDVDSLPHSEQASRLRADFKAALSRSDSIAAARVYVGMTRSIPGSVATDAAQSELQSAVLSLLGQVDDRSKPLKKAILRQLKDLGMERIFFWGRLFYNRGHFVESAQLLSRWWDLAEDDDYIRHQDPKAYELVIDSALAVDQDQLLEEVAGFLIDRFPGTASARTAAFRSGLLRFRNGDWAGAVSRFESILSDSIRDGLDLQSRYWLWQSLSKFKSSERATVIRDSLISRYPFSYYGLRALIDRDKGRLIWRQPDASYEDQARSPGSSYALLWLTRSESRSFRRVQHLFHLGWLEYAHQELLSLPVPTDPKGRSQFAKLWAQTQNFIQASRLANLAWDEDPSIRSFDLMREVWPLAYGGDVEKAAEEFKLEKELVQALTKQESGFNPKAISSSKAMGLMQMIPPTATEIASALKLGPLNLPEDLFFADRNIRMGTYYLAKMIGQFNGVVPLGVAAYNAGPTRLQRWIQSRSRLRNLTEASTSDPESEVWFDEIPYSETSFYVKAVMRNLLIYRLLSQPTDREGKKTLDLAHGIPLWMKSP